jgi:DNA invertase Pin-like site-specific DNA recombinase
VKAGLRNARAKGKKLGRPKVILDASKIAKLREQGLGWKKISRELGVGVSTVLRIAHEARESGSENSNSKSFRTRVRKTRFDSAGGSAVAATDFPQVRSRASFRDKG